MKSMDRAPDMVWHCDTHLGAYDLIVVPGGFSYGDYLRSGAIAAHSPVMREVAARARGGTPVLGICNGFQILIEAGLLPGALIRNASLKFICRDVLLRVETTASPFTNAYTKDHVLRIPIAHHDGNYFADETTLNRIDDEDRVALRYCNPKGKLTVEANPNGSARSIAGILGKDRNVLGLMPHPERLADALLGGNDGRAMFDGLVGACTS
jgi:phosphoribosylformylglycinamidine synthase